MEKSNIYAPGDKRMINPDWFTNKVHMKDISSKIKSKEQDIYHVYFENGAKTKMHLHNGNQNTQRVGILCIRILSSQTDFGTARRSRVQQTYMAQAGAHVRRSLKLGAD